MTSYPRQDPYAVMAGRFLVEFHKQFKEFVETCQKDRGTYLKIIENQADQLDELHKELDALTEERRTMLRQQSNLNQSE